MDTHAMFGIIYRNGAFRVVERTMDGYHLVSLLPYIVEHIEDSERMRHLTTMEGSKAFGRGGYQLQTNARDEREHEQEYAVLVDYRTRTLWISYTMVQVGIDEICRLNSELKRKGWTMELFNDLTEEGELI